MVRIFEVRSWMGPTSSLLALTVHDWKGQTYYVNDCQAPRLQVLLTMIVLFGLLGLSRAVLA